MGTFAGIYAKKGSVIPKDKRDEFAERIEKVFEAGGMMDVEWLVLYGKSIKMIRKASIQNGEMNFYYNYFEDDMWENAGFNKTGGYVWSNKIGSMHFHRAVVAAYVLEEQYTDGISAVMVNGELVNSGAYIGWLNYLFNEKKHIKNFDKWKLFETIYFDDNDRYISWYDTGGGRYAFISGCEIYAMLNGYEKALAKYGDVQKGELEELAINSMKNLVNELNNYADECKENKESQLKVLMDTFRMFYETDEKPIENTHVSNEKIRNILGNLLISDAPAFAVKVISEIYKVDFWELWRQIRDVARRRLVELYGNEGYYIVPISTEEFMRQSPDDMIPYWEEGCELNFSDELQEWFKDLKKLYDNLLDEEFNISNMLLYVTNLLNDANENYYNIYAFSDFWEETLEHLQDKKYQVLWKIFDSMIKDPEMKKAGEVIFVPEGPGHEKEGLHYIGEEPKRRLICNWSFMESSKRNNRARLTLRRYMALVGNKDLREKVFGF